MNLRSVLTLVGRIRSRQWPPFDGTDAYRVDGAPGPVRLALGAKFVKDDSVQPGPHPVLAPLGKPAVHRLPSGSEDWGGAGARYSRTWRRTRSPPAPPGRQHADGHPPVAAARPSAAHPVGTTPINRPEPGALQVPPCRLNATRRQRKRCPTSRFRSRAGMVAAGAAATGLHRARTQASWTCGCSAGVPTGGRQCRSASGQLARSSRGEGAFTQRVLEPGRSQNGGSS